MYDVWIEQLHESNPNGYTMGGGMKMIYDHFELKLSFFFYKIENRFALTFNADKLDVDVFLHSVY